MAKPSVAICAIARDEGPYLAEWAVYHHLLGFDPILVYNHQSEDDSAEQLAAMEAHGIAQQVELSTEPDERPQRLAYADGQERLRGDVDWILFIDIDEFLVLPRHEDIQAFLAEHEELDALAINWKMFGSSGHAAYEPGLVIERFTGCAPADFKGNRAVKTLARPGAFTTPRAHTCLFEDSVEYRTVAGEVIPQGEGRSERVVHDPIRLHHYFTKSRQEWDWKMKRGRGGQAETSHKRHRTEREFNANDRNDQSEHEIQERAPAVRRLLDALRLPSPSA
jgi:hypothetical protein